MIRGKHQTYNDGVVKIYSVRDESELGEAPEPKLELKAIMRFKRRTVGVKRYWAAKQENVQADQLIRVSGLASVSTQDIAVVNGAQYRIQQVQYPEDAQPRVMDLTLERLRTSRYLMNGVGACEN